MIKRIVLCVVMVVVGGLLLGPWGAMGGAVLFIMIMGGIHS